MAETKYGKYIIREPLGKSMFEHITAPQLAISGARHCDGANFSMGWSYITSPFVMVDEAHTHEFDQLLCFIGEDPKDVMAFDAEVELSLGEDSEKQIINTTSVVYIPKGLKHCPLNITRVSKPFMFMDMVLSSQPSVKPRPKSS